MSSRASIWETLDGVARRVTGWTAIAKAADVIVRRVRQLPIREHDRLPVPRDRKTRRMLAFLSAIAK